MNNLERNLARATGIITVLTALFPWAWSNPAIAADGAGGDTCAVVGIDGVGERAFAEVTSVPGARWWVEMGDRMLLCGDGDIASQAEAVARPVAAVFESVTRSNIWLVHGEGLPRSWPRGARVLIERRRFALLTMEESGRSPLAVSSPHLTSVRLDPPVSVIRQVRGTPSHPGVRLSHEATDLSQQVDAARWYADVVALAGLTGFTVPVVFSDDFESGALNEWSAAHP